jgi:hypothetical protein
MSNIESLFHSFLVLCCCTGLSEASAFTAAIIDDPDPIYAAIEAHQKCIIGGIHASPTLGVLRFSLGRVRAKRAASQG